MRRLIIMKILKRILFFVYIITLSVSAYSQEMNYLDLTYEGRDKDASWRKRAAENIEKYRKAALKINVFDADKNPVPGVTVEVEMQRHKFCFGSAVNVTYLTGDSKDADLYKQKFLKNFKLD